MSKASEMAKVSAKGGFNLMWGLIVSTVISFLGILVITYILGAQNYGLYVIAISGPTLIATFRDWGVNSAMVKYSAEYNVEDKAKIRSIIFSGIIFEITLGLSLSLFSFAISPFIASSLNRPTIVPLIQIASFFVLGGALVNSATAAFTGLEKMHLYSFMLIIQSTVKTALIIGLVLLGFGTLGAITGYTVSYLLAGSAGLLLVWTFYRLLPKSETPGTKVISTIKTMFGYGFPVSIGSILTAFLSSFYTFALGHYVSDNALVGDYGLATNFSILISFFSIPVATMLFPAFSKLDYKKDRETLKNVFKYSVKYASLIVVPVATLVMTLAQPGVRTIYQNSYAEAPLYLALVAATYLYAALGNLSVGTLLNGQGFTTYNMYLSVIQIAVGFPVGFLLISRFGVIGLLLSSLTVGLPSLLVGLRFVKQTFGATVDWLSSAKILLSSAIAASLTYVLNSELPLASIKVAFWRITFHVSVALQQILIGLIAFVIIFLLAAVLTQTIDQNEFASLQEIANSLGPLRRPLRFLLNALAKLMARLHPKKSGKN